MRLEFKILMVFLVNVAVLQPQAATRTIEMRNNFFSTNKPTIQQGDTGIWRQRGSNQAPAREDGLRSSGILAAGRPFSFTFDPPGSYGYFCSPHRSQGMTGTITVEGAANTPPTVTLTAPANGAEFAPSDNITFT